MLGELPKDQQDIARCIVHSHMRKNSTGSEPGSPLAAASPKILSPGTPPTHRGGGGDGLDQEEVYRSLRKTTAEIQNYSYETLGSKLDRDRDTTSQDSGISQMSLGGANNDIMTKVDGVAILEDKMEELSLRGRGPRSLPPYGSTANGVGGGGETTDSSNGYKSLGDLKDTDFLKNILEKCVVDYPLPVPEKRLLLVQLVDTIKQGHCIEFIKLNFKWVFRFFGFFKIDALCYNKKLFRIIDISPKYNLNVWWVIQFSLHRKLLRLIIDALNQNDSATKVIVLEILAAIFQNKNLEPCWSNFVELITIRVMQSHCDEKREVISPKFVINNLKIVVFPGW